MSKTPIEPADIRKGDLIRWEYEGDGGWLELTACEARVKRDGQRLSNQGGQHYLLDRPKPPVDLPVKPELGWIKFRDGDRWLGLVEAGKGRPETFSASIDRGYTSDSWVVAAVDTFTPATAVPTEALAEMRHKFTDTSLPMSQQIAAGDKFLCAIDKANA